MGNGGGGGGESLVFILLHVSCVKGSNPSVWLKAFLNEQADQIIRIYLP